MPLNCPRLPIARLYWYTDDVAFVNEKNRDACFSFERWVRWSCPCYVSQKDKGNTRAKWMGDRDHRRRERFTETERTRVMPVGGCSDPLFCKIVPTLWPVTFMERHTYRQGTAEGEEEEAGGRDAASVEKWAQTWEYLWLSAGFPETGTMVPTSTLILQQRGTLARNGRAAIDYCTINLAF